MTRPLPPASGLGEGVQAGAGESAVGRTLTFLGTLPAAGESKTQGASSEGDRQGRPRAGSPRGHGSRWRRRSQSHAGLEAPDPGMTPHLRAPGFGLKCAARADGLPAEREGSPALDASPGRKRGALGLRPRPGRPGWTLGLSCGLRVTGARDTDCGKAASHPLGPVQLPFSRRLQWTPPCVLPGQPLPLAQEGLPSCRPRGSARPVGAPASQPQGLGWVCSCDWVGPESCLEPVGTRRTSWC